MDKDCKVMLMKEEQDFAVECFELLLEAEGQEQTFAYRRAFQDCIVLLKSLGVLSQHF